MAILLLNKDVSSLDSLKNFLTSESSSAIVIRAQDCQVISSKVE